MQKNKMPVPTEAQEQMTLFSWAAMQSGKYPELNLLYHVITSRTAGADTRRKRDGFGRRA